MEIYGLTVCAGFENAVVQIVLLRDSCQPHIQCAYKFPSSPRATLRRPRASLLVIGQNLRDGMKPVHFRIYSCKTFSVLVLIFFISHSIVRVTRTIALHWSSYDWNIGRHGHNVHYNLHCAASLRPVSNGLLELNFLINYTYKAFT